MCGEIAILDPWAGSERVTVTADTSVEVLLIDKFQIDYRLKCNGLQNTIYKLIREKTKEIPESGDVVTAYIYYFVLLLYFRLQNEREWERKRNRIIKSLRLKDDKTLDLKM